MSEGSDALWYAAEGGVEDAVRALLGQGVRPDVWRNVAGWTALHGAAQEGRTGVARLLIEARADLEAKGDSMSTQLHYAADMSSADALRLLLNKGANIAAADGRELTPLHDAARTSDAATIETLLLWGADLDAQNNNGKTPRDIASTSGHGNTAAFDAVVAMARGLFWTRALHLRLPRPSREVVVAVLLCLRRVALRPARRPHPTPLPALPVELWEMILGMVRAVDLLPRRL